MLGLGPTPTHRMPEHQAALTEALDNSTTREAESQEAGHQGQTTPMSSHPGGSGRWLDKGGAGLSDGKTTCDTKEKGKEGLCVGAA